MYARKRGTNAKICIISLSDKDVLKKIEKAANLAAFLSA